MKIKEIFKNKQLKELKNDIIDGEKYLNHHREEITELRKNYEESADVVKQQNYEKLRDINQDFLLMNIIQTRTEERYSDKKREIKMDILIVVFSIITIIIGIFHYLEFAKIIDLLK